MTFHVGQKVVCVNDDWGDPGDWACHYWISRVPNKPRRGRIYHVREIQPSIFDDEPEIALLLAELINPRVWWGPRCPSMEGSFSAGRFRPVTERKTDISIFRRMLIDAPKELERGHG